MAEAIPFLGANRELKPDPHRDDYSLPVFAKNNEWVSCWMLTQEEINRIQETGRIWLRIRAKVHPFVGIETEEPFSDNE